MLLLWCQVAGFGNKYLRKNGEQTRVTAQQVEESVNGSLSRLGTDYIDLLQVSHQLCKIMSERQTPLEGASVSDLTTLRTHIGN